MSTLKVTELQKFNRPKNRWLALATATALAFGSGMAWAQVDANAVASNTADADTQWNWVTGANALSWSPSIPGVNGTSDTATITVTNGGSSRYARFYFNQDLTNNSILLKGMSTCNYTLGNDTTRRTITWVPKGDTAASLTFLKGITTGTGNNPLRNQFYANSVLKTDLVVNFAYQASKDGVFGGIVSGSGKLTLNFATNANNQTPGSSSVLTVGTANDAPSTHTGGTKLIVSSTSTLMTTASAFTWKPAKVNAFGTGLLELNKVRLDLATFNQTVGGLGDGGNASLILASSTTSGTTTLTLNFDGTTNSYAGTLQDSTNGVRRLALVKSGTGTQILSGTNAFSGTNAYSASTTVLGGALLLSDTISGTGTGLLDVQSGATFGGTGTNIGPVTVRGGGNLAPGLPVGALALGGDLALQFGATCTLDLSTSAASGNDQITVGGNLNLNNNVLTIAGPASPNSLDEATDYVLMTLSGSGSISGMFATTPAWLGTAPANAANFIVVTDPGTKQVLLRHVATPQGASTTTLALTTGSSPSTVGDSLTFTATVTGAAPSGAVTFYDGATLVGTSPLTDVGGGVYQASVTTSAIAPGTHTLSASYPGDLNNTSSVGTLAQTVNRALTTTALALTSGSNPSVAGASLTFTATVSGSGGTPTGSVVFNDGATPIKTNALAGGQATLATTNLAAGTHLLTAVYTGDATYTNSTSSALSQTVLNPTTTAVALTSGTNPAALGELLVFTATVSGPGAPTGSVVFSDGTTPLSTNDLVSGQASLSVSTLAAGPHSIVATYSGDSANGPSTNSVAQTILYASSTVLSLTSGTNPSLVGDSLTFTATVVGDSSPTGTVTFSDGTTPLATNDLVSGQAVLTVSNLVAGAHSITAVYNGDATHAVSTSTPLVQTVNAAQPPTPVLSSSGFSLADGVPTFTFETVAGYKYHLVYKNTLSDPEWTPVAAAVLADSNSMTLTDPTAAGQPNRFYRIEALNP